MKKGILAAFLMISLLASLTACQPADNRVNPGDGSKSDSENLDIIPFGERHFIYSNGLEYKEEQVSTVEGTTRIYRSNLVLSGFVDKEVEEKVNKDIAASMEQGMKDILASAASKNAGNAPAVISKELGAHVTYNCNNVIFIEYYESAEFTLSSGESLSLQNIEGAGYDLNTGSRLQLKDLFKKDSGYEKMINDFIAVYIIENNYDDPDSAFMSKPFQGIREGQNFTFSISGLNIIMDEKNDEFQKLGYPIIITIPVAVIGDELAVFDRYYDGKTNLFEKKGLKKLLPNQSGFKVSKLLQESLETYSIYVEEGEFINIADSSVKYMLDSLAACTLDVDAFRKRAEAQAAANPGKYFGSIGHCVNTAMNEGGFMSIIIRDSYYENGTGQETTKYINYDFNSNKVMKLEGIFAAGYDYKSAIAGILNNPANDYLPSYSEQSKIKMDSISEDNFSFDENGVVICLNQQQSDGSYPSYWISYDKIGWDNLVMYGNGTGTATVSEYIIPGSDSRYLTDSDLAGLTKEQLAIARNEIFARHGYIFMVQKYVDYFSSKSWYKADPSYTGELSDIEEYNVNLIKERESDQQ